MWAALRNVSFNLTIDVQDILTFAVLITTVYIALFAHRFTRISTYLAITSQSLGIVNEFDKCVLQSDENARAIEDLRAPPKGLSIRQEYLMFLYLNHVELTYRSWQKGLIDRGTLYGFTRDGLSYFVTRPEALKPMLINYADYFAKFVWETFEREFPKSATLAKQFERDKKVDKSP